MVFATIPEIILASSNPVFAGALLAAVNFFEIHKPIIRKLKQWLLPEHKKCSGLRSYYKRKNFLSYKKKSSGIKSTCKKWSQLTVPIADSFASITFSDTSFTKRQNGDEATELPNGNILLMKIIKLCKVNNREGCLSAPPLRKLRSTIKIAEESYSGIYVFKHVVGSRRTKKCMSLDGKQPDKISPNMPQNMALPDIISSTFLCQLNENPYFIAPNSPRNFSISLVNDYFPELMVTRWREFKNSSKESQNPSEHPPPDLCDEHQIILPTETSFGENTLTTEVLQNAWLRASIMSQLVSALAVVEEAYKIEHRDLAFGKLRHQEITGGSTTQELSN